MTVDAIIVFSRMDSRRLPGKALADLDGRPLLLRVIDRLRRVRSGEPILVATSDRAVDDPINDLAEREGIETFRGDCDDVAGRAIACCDSRSLESFVRISGDSPFIPPEVIDQLINVSREEDADLITNLFPRSWPPGASVEIIKAEALRRAHRHMSRDEREHVTAHFYATPEAWRICNVSAQDETDTSMRLTVDTHEELEWARKLCAKLGGRPDAAPLDQLIKTAESLETSGDQIHHE